MSAVRDLAGVARSVAERAERGEDVDVMVSTGRSTIVRVHGGEVESFTSAESFAIGIRVISDHRQGFAAAGSIDPDVIAETLSEARDNVRFGLRMRPRRTRPAPATIEARAAGFTSLPIRA